MYPGCFDCLHSLTTKHILLAQPVKYSIETNSTLMEIVNKRTFNIINGFFVCLYVVIMYICQMCCFPLYVWT